MQERKYKLSLSVSNGDVSEQHTRRVYCPSSAEPTLMSQNVHVIDDINSDKSLVTYQEQFDSFFYDSIEEYNKKQRRKDRKKSHSYYEELLSNGKRKEQPVYSTVIQLGNRDTCGITDTTFDDRYWHELKKTNPEAASEYVAEHLDTRPIHDRTRLVLSEIAEHFEEWYPQLHVVAAVIHSDEPGGTDHLTVDWIPWSDDYKTGLKKRCSQSKALKQMGFEGRGFAYPIKEWQADIKQHIEEVMTHYGIERELVGDKSAHEDVATYRMRMEREEEATKLKEIKRRQEVARIVEEDQKQRIEGLEKEIEKNEARAKRAEDRAEKAEYRLELAREDLQDLRDDIQDLQRIQKVLEEDNEKKKKEISSWEKRIEELKKRFEELKAQVTEYEARLSKLAKAIVQMSWVPELYQHPIKSFLNWLNHRINVAGGDAEPNEIIAHEVLSHTQEDFYRECGQDVQRELRKYIKEHPELATNKEIKAAQNSPETTRDTSFIKSGSSMYIMQ